jgi:membrane protease YdiL (CAAX protease family)
MSKGSAGAAWLELFAVTGLLLSLTGHRRRGETARDLGFRLDNLGSSARVVFSCVLPLLAVMVGLGLALNLHRELPIERLWARVALMPLFGIAQQYGLVGFYYRRFQEVLSGVWIPILASTLVFASLHAPNVPVMVMTFALGIGACWLYRRAPNLWVLGLAHGLLSLTVAMLLAKLLVSGLKVGPRALR